VNGAANGEYINLAALSPVWQVREQNDGNVVRLSPFDVRWPNFHSAAAACLSSAVFHNLRTFASLSCTTSSGGDGSERASERARGLIDGVMQPASLVILAE